MTPRALARKIRKLRPHPSITLQLESAMHARGTWNRDRAWYKSQKEYWLGWLSEYDGPGYYGRTNSHRSAEFVYNHINCAPMVLWLGEAAGVSIAKVKAAKRAALGAKPSPAAAAAAVRKKIAWPEIEEHLI
jgi:hypothetical protein